MQDFEINEYADNVISDPNELEALQEAEELVEAEPFEAESDIRRKALKQLQECQITFQEFMDICKYNFIKPF
jgi:hypothetical protein